jgi:deoxyribonuclease V
MRGVALALSYPEKESITELGSFFNVREQSRLKSLLNLTNDISLAQLNFVGGVDLSFPLDDTDHAVACLVVLEFPSLKLVHSSFKNVELSLPYIPGFLAFREVQPLLELLNDLKNENSEIYPQVILVDGI